MRRWTTLASAVVLLGLSGCSGGSAGEVKESDVEDALGLVQDNRGGRSLTLVDGTKCTVGRILLDVDEIRRARSEYGFTTNEDETVAVILYADPIKFWNECHEDVSELLEDLP